MTDNQATDTIRLLKAGRVIPDVIPTSSNFSPDVFFSIIWPSNGTEVTEPGSTVPKGLTNDEPQIKLLPTFVSNDEALYTIVMTDPDAPSRVDPKFGEWRHWILSGLTSPRAELASSSQGQILKKSKSTITPYYPPEPPAGSGPHRYVFLLFREPAGGIAIPDDAVERKAESGNRSKWNAMAFAHQYDLKLVGANFFLTEVKTHG
ncbi:hypothetical protein CVT25_005415 [Psilocybe cyanescens]|uniref:Phosphatidylethanolamine-binding protein n=1 Tax=Psilocybe cyanescens TaxID=93625 RepID=A0A409WXC5_PSICY|nr:hypothetical protein CVT25_005415 [Psilocybe cyanescens]